MGMAANVFSFAAMRTAVAMGTAVFSSMGLVNVSMGTAIFSFAAMGTDVTLGFAGGLPFVVGVVHRRQ